MNDAVITVKNLSKKYRIKQGDGTAVPSYSALRDVIADKFTGLFENRKSKVESRKSVEDFWALKDVSFEVHQGEVIGIIGRNGAGKTTLLKILSRITEPTEGRVRIKGRVASLLEVGTGFHPELTGRENIFLNGAILGMTRIEIKRKFDEIVAFAELEKFLDTPVKRYSSGMYVRLAFAVAAHLDPDVLIVDEVLAVGDVAFQRKCISKMGDVTSTGASTVLLVSHNLAVIRTLCGRGVYLNRGRIVKVGEAGEVTQAYLDSLSTVSDKALVSREDRQGQGEIRFTAVRYLVNDSIETETVATGDKVSVVLEFECRERISRPSFVCSFFDPNGACALICESAISSPLIEPIGASGAVVCELERFPLLPGTYRLNVGAKDDSSGRLIDRVEGAAVLEVTDGDFFRTGRPPRFWAARVVAPNKWRILYPAAVERK
jgi:lipopolysaccharide transport system ATP-binding protein